jgi:hypothetical protein
MTNNTINVTLICRNNSTATVTITRMSLIVSLYTAPEANQTLRLSAMLSEPTKPAKPISTDRRKFDKFKQAKTVETF